MIDSQLLSLYELSANKHYNKIQELSSPLQTHLNINYFSHQRIKVDGSYSLLSNRVDFFEEYLETKFYRRDPFLISPSHYTLGRKVFIIRDNIHCFDAKAKTIIRKFERSFAFNETLLIVSKHLDYFDVFVFVTPLRGVRGINMLLANYRMIDRFIEYFLRFSPTMLCEFDEVGANIAKLRGKKFLANDLCSLIETETDTNFRIKFLNALKLS